MHLVKRFIAYYRPHKLLFGADMAASLLISLLGMVYPVMTNRLLNDFIPNRAYRSILIAGSVVLLLYLVRMLLRYFVQYQGHMVGTYMQAQMRRELFAHLERLPFSFFDDHETGAIMTRMTNDLFEVSELAVGFICSMLFVNFMRDPSNPALQFQHSYWQFYVSGILGLILSIYSLSLPNCPCKPKGQTSSLADSLGLRAFKLFGKRHFAIFFIFAMLLGAALQITNGYANTFITSFKDIPAFADTWGARNANALISISQMSETLCILLIPFFMKRFGIKGVMLISMFAWVLRFGLFGAGNPGSGVWMFVLSCIVYGMAFDFFNISGALYVNKNTSNDIQSSAQGLFMLMTNGLGASIGTWAAGKVVNAVVYNSAAPSWPKAWFIFAGYALVVAIAFAFLFKEPKTDAQSA